MFTCHVGIGSLCISYLRRPFHLWSGKPKPIERGACNNVITNENIFVNLFSTISFRDSRNPSLSADGTWASEYWPQHTPVKREVLELNANYSRVIDGLRVKKCAFWKKFLPRLLALGKIKENTKPPSFARNWFFLLKSACMSYVMPSCGLIKCASLLLLLLFH